MRKIETALEKEKKDKRKTWIISSLLLAILVFGTAGYGFIFSGGNSNTNGNQNNQDPGGRYNIDFQGASLSFAYTPEQVNEIDVNISSSLQDLLDSTLYISSDNKAVFDEIAFNLGSFIPRYQEACYGSCDKDLPEKNCSDNLIVWEDSENNKVYQEDKCVFVEGDLRSVDAFLFKIFGI